MRHDRDVENDSSDGDTRLIFVKPARIEPSRLRSVGLTTTWQRNR